MEVKILGGCCTKCDVLKSNTEKVLKEMGKNSVQVEKINDFIKIAKYGVMKTPALVINEKVIFSGRTADEKELVEIFSKY